MKRETVTNALLAIRDAYSVRAGILSTEDLRHRLETRGFKNIQYFRKGAAEVVFATQFNTVVIVFPGSDEWRDWVYNTATIPIKSVGLRMHYGFRSYFRLIREAIREYVRQHRAEKLLLIGHSLGGPSAIQAALDLAPAVDGTLVTFGSPRLLCGKKSTDRANQLLENWSIFQFAGENDPVTMAPPGHWGFRHLRIHKITPHGIRTLDGDPYWTRFVGWLRRLVNRHVTPWQSVKSHFEQNYAKALLNLEVPE